MSSKEPKSQRASPAVQILADRGLNQSSKATMECYPRQEVRNPSQGSPCDPKDIFSILSLRTTLWAACCRVGTASRDSLGKIIRANRTDVGEGRRGWAVSHDRSYACDLGAIIDRTCSCKLQQCTGSRIPERRVRGPCSGGDLPKHIDRHDV